MAIPGIKLNYLIVDELVQLRAKGYSIRRIAVELGLSKRTVHKYVRLIEDDPTFGKLNDATENLSSGSETTVEK